MPSQKPSKSFLKYIQELWYAPTGDQTGGNIKLFVIRNFVLPKSGLEELCGKPRLKEKPGETEEDRRSLIEHSLFRIWSRLQSEWKSAGKFKMTDEEKARPVLATEELWDQLRNVIKRKLEESSFPQLTSNIAHRDSPADVKIGKTRRRQPRLSDQGITRRSHSSPQTPLSDDDGRIDGRVSLLTENMRQASRHSWSDTVPRRASRPASRTADRKPYRDDDFQHSPDQQAERSSARRRQDTEESAAETDDDRTIYHDAQPDPPRDIMVNVFMQLKQGTVSRLVRIQAAKMSEVETKNIESLEKRLLSKLNIPQTVPRPWRFLVQGAEDDYFEAVDDDALESVISEPKEAKKGRIVVTTAE